MEFKELIAQRRSIRRFSDRPVPREVVDRLLAEALTAPSARNTRTTRFLVVDDPAKAKESLTQKGFVTRVNDVIGAELKDEKGNLNQMLKILADGEINVNYIYSFVIREEKAPVIVFHTDDFQKAEQVLKDAEVKLVEESEL